MPDQAEIRRNRGEIMSFCRGADTVAVLVLVAVLVAVLGDLGVVGDGSPGVAGLEGVFADAGFLRCCDAGCGGT